MSVPEKVIREELSGVMDRFTGAMNHLAAVYSERRNRQRDIYWLALQTAKEHGAMVLHSRIMLKKAWEMEPLASIRKSNQDCYEEAEHYHGYREILNWYLEGQPCDVPEMWGYGDFALGGGAGPALKQALWPEHYGYIQMAQQLARDTSSAWVKEVIASNREGAAVAFHYAMSKLPANDEYMTRIVQHEKLVAEDELHHGPEMIEELAKAEPSQADLDQATSKIESLRIQELRQRNEQFMQVLSPGDLQQLEQDFVGRRVQPVPLFSGMAVA
jgi:hypothetical protein